MYLIIWIPFVYKLHSVFLCVFLVRFWLHNNAIIYKIIFVTRTDNIKIKTVIVTFLSVIETCSLSKQSHVCLL